MPERTDFIWDPGSADPVLGSAGVRSTSRRRNQASALLLLKVDRAEVRAMDRHMAERTSLVFRCLVVERRYARHRGVNRQRVAAQAQQVDLAVIQKPGIG